MNVQCSKGWNAWACSIILLSIILLLHAVKVTSEVTVAPSVTGYVSHANTNCPGNDIRSLHSNTPADCATVCDGEEQCVAFVFQYFQVNPPQFCYLKTDCAEEALFSDTDIHVYIKSTVHETTTTVADVTSSSDTTSASPITEEVTEMTFVWYTYSEDTEVYEAPLAVPIGSIMIVLLIGFLLFFLLLDTGNCVKSLKMAHKNCLRAARDRRKKREVKGQGDKVKRSPGGESDGPVGTTGPAGTLSSGLKSGLITFTDIEDDAEGSGKSEAFVS